MAYQDGSSLGKGQGEYICEHHYVDDICSGREGLVADHVYEIGDHYLRKAVGHMLSRRRDTDFQQILKFHPRERAEKLLRERRDVLLEEYDHKYGSRYETAE